MAKIIKTRSPDKELFPSSLVAVSDILYRRIAKTTEQQLGTKIRKITYNAIQKRLTIPEFRDIILVSRKNKTIFLSIVVTDISFSASQENSLVSICLLLPLRGEYQKIQKLIEGIIEEIGLKNAHCAQNGIETQITLTNENLPHQITPNPFSSLNGKGQKVFAIKKEILLGCSPIR